MCCRVGDPHLHFFFYTGNFGKRIKDQTSSDSRRHFVDNELVDNWRLSPDSRSAEEPRAPFGTAPAGPPPHHGSRFLGCSHHFLRAGAGAWEAQGVTVIPQDAAAPPRPSQGGQRVGHGSWSISSSVFPDLSIPSVFE
jgi:hypothetical protein